MGCILLARLLQIRGDHDIVPGSGSEVTKITGDSFLVLWLALVSLRFILSNCAFS